MTRSRTIALLAALVLGVLATLAPSGGAVAAGSKPAPVKITFKQDFSGRVTSDRAACVRFRTVFAFVRSEGEVTPVGSTSTDSQGRYPNETRRRGVGGDAEAFTLVTGSNKCRVAQSRSIAAPNRAGSLAKRKVTFQAGTQSASGRVTSKRASCVKQVPIILFVETSPGEFQPVTGTTTDNRGRFGFGSARTGVRGQSVDLFVVAIGDDHCSVAQSPTRTVG